MTIARGRWQEHLKSGGDYYHARARELEALHAEHPEVGADSRRARPPRAGRAARALPRRAADPPPARPAAPRRADRPGRGRRGARPARAARGRQAAAPEGAHAACAPSALARRQPRVRARRRADHRDRGRPPAWRAPTAASSATSSSASTSRRSIAPRPGCSPTCRPSPTPSTHASALTDRLRPKAGLNRDLLRRPRRRHRRRRRHPPRRPRRRGLLGQRHAPAATRSATSTRRAGIRRSTTTPTRRRPRRRTRRSAAGCATGTGTRCAWKLPIPPKVGDAMDDAQKWAVACTRMALTDYGWPERPLDLERTAVILGNAMAGEKHYLTTLRITFPELARELDARRQLRRAARRTCARRSRRELHARTGRLAARRSPRTRCPASSATASPAASRTSSTCAGPNFIVDAACASAMAAMDAVDRGPDRARSSTPSITGGVDRNMGVSIVHQVLRDRRAVGDRHAPVRRRRRRLRDGRGRGPVRAQAPRRRRARRRPTSTRSCAASAGSSDGKGKGITAPNPIGQKLAIERAWRNAGLSPAECSLVEGHGTSTRVGDVVELSSLSEAFAGAGLAPGSIALGSVKSNIGHLKAAAGAAGMLKTTLALHHKVLPPSLGFERPEPERRLVVDAVRGQHRAARLGRRRRRHPRRGRQRVRLRRYQLPRRAWRSTCPAALQRQRPRRRSRCRRTCRRRTLARSPAPPARPPPASRRCAARSCSAPPTRRASPTRCARARRGAPGPPPRPRAAERRGAARARADRIDYADAGELAAKADSRAEGDRVGQPGGVEGAAGPRDLPRQRAAPARSPSSTPGQGSQYANMLAELRRTRADRRRDVRRGRRDHAAAARRARAVGHHLRRPDDGVAEAEAQLLRTEITQPAVLTVDIALTRLLAAYGIEPDFVMGHSLGEYGALVAAGVAVVRGRARGRERPRARDGAA